VGGVCVGVVLGETNSGDPEATLPLRDLILCHCKIIPSNAVTALLRVSVVNIATDPIRARKQQIKVKGHNEPNRVKGKAAAETSASSIKSAHSHLVIRVALVTRLVRRAGKLFGEVLVEIGERSVNRT
jgi:hypothetical protein